MRGAVHKGRSLIVLMLRKRAGWSYWARRQQVLEEVEQEVINIGLVESNTTLGDDNTVAEQPDGGEENQKQ